MYFTKIILKFALRLALALLFAKLVLFIIPAAHLTATFNIPLLGFISGTQVFLTLLTFCSLILTYLFEITAELLYESWNTASSNDTIKTRNSLKNFCLAMKANFTLNTFVAILLPALLIAAFLFLTLPIVKTISGVILGYTLPLAILFIMSDVFCRLFTDTFRANNNPFYLLCHDSLILLSLASIVLSTIPLVTMLASVIPNLFFLHNTAYAIIISAVILTPTLKTLNSLSSYNNDDTRYFDAVKDQLSSKFINSEALSNKSSNNKYEFHSTQLPSTTTSMP